jgi:hypothetical protein
MDRRELRNRKARPKTLPKVEFKPLRKGALPRPLKELGGPRLTASKLVDVGNGLKVVFVVRSGDILERKAFFAYLFEEHNDVLVPLAILHYHPSHKGVHLIVNCETGREFGGRQLPGAPEFALKSARLFDPEDPNDRSELILAFCKRCNISIGDASEQLRL